MRDAVVVDAVRLPVGKRQGTYREIHPQDLSAHVLNGLVNRASVDPAEIDDVVWGCVSQIGEQGFNIGRSAVLSAGWPERIPATTVDRQCGSSQQAVHFAAALVMSGQCDIVIAGGVESMTRVPLGASFRNGPGSPFSEQITQRYGVDDFDQGVGAEMMADKWGLSRVQLDEFSLLSHSRAAAAIDSGSLEGQCIPMSTCSLVDEGVRRKSTLETLAALPPVFKADGKITAGNSSQISDGSAALLITTSEFAKYRGWRPMVRLHSFAVVGDDPVMMLGAPIPATAQVLKKAGIGLEDVGAYEVNEAFASVPLAWLYETGGNPEFCNPQGGAIAVGHPLGASGAVLMTRLSHYMHQNGIRFGLQTMCEGGGMANATILELLNEAA